MKTLYLPLKKKWYDMIERGEKTEEYRELSDYWVNRLRDKALTCVDRNTIKCSCDIGCWTFAKCGFEIFDSVCFSCGYSKRRMTFECKGITIGKGRPEWGAPDYETFIIKLGKGL